MKEQHVSREWRKSSHSSAGQDCVEFRCVDDGVQIRNSKRPDAGTIHYTNSEWTAFIAGVKNGEFDL